MKGVARHLARRNPVPISTVAASDMNSCMICGAKISYIAMLTAATASPRSRENQTVSIILFLFFAA